MARPQSLDRLGASTISARLVTFQESRRSRDAVLLVGRLVLAWVFIYHGAGKLFGFRHQGGIADTTGFFQFENIPAAHAMAYAAGITEFFGGILLVVGLVAPLVALALTLDMIGAIFYATHKVGMLPKGVPGGDVADGFEINIVLAGLALVIVLLGAGRFSLDYLIGFSKRPSD